MKQKDQLAGKGPLNHGACIPGGHLVTVEPLVIFGEESGQAKVCNLEVASGTDEKVSWLQILQGEGCTYTRRCVPCLSTFDPPSPAYLTSVIGLYCTMA